MNKSSVMITGSAQKKTIGSDSRSLESRSVTSTSTSSGRSCSTRGIYHLSATEDAVTTNRVSSSDGTQGRKSPSRALHINCLDESVARNVRVEDTQRAHTLLATESDRAPNPLQVGMKIKQRTSMSGKKSRRRSHRRLTPNGENETIQTKSTCRSTRRVSQNLCPNSQQKSYSSQEVDESDEMEVYLRKIERLGGSLPFASTADHVAQVYRGRSSESGEGVEYSRDKTDSSQPPRLYNSTLLYPIQDEELISKRNPISQDRNDVEFREPCWKDASLSTVKPFLDQAEDEVRRKYGVGSASKSMMPLHARQGESFRRQEVGVSSNEEELSLPPDQMRAFAHPLLDQLSNLEDNVLVKGNASTLDKTRVLQARGERSPIDSNIPSPPLFRRETRLRTITVRVTKETSREVPGTLLPGAYRAGNWETESVEDDCSMTYSERLMHLSDSERQREEERDIQMARNQLLSSQSLHLSQDSRNESESQVLARDRSVFMEEGHSQEQADAHMNPKIGISPAFRRRIICATVVLVIGATVGIVLGLLREESQLQLNGDSYRCLYDLNLAEQCNSNGRLSSVPNCVYNRYRLMEKELGILIAGSIDSCSSSNLALLSMAAANQPLYLSNYVLSNLFFATSGPTSWTKITNWATANSVCDWEGITCRLRCKGDDGNNHKCDEDPVQVIGISLNNNGLVGRLPSELGLLSTLETITFASNSLEGALPIELGSLASLNYLELGRNNISGAIPTAFASLTNLREFRVMSAQLSGSIPSEIGLMNSLVVLDFSSNRLTGRLPSEVGALSALENLKIGQNSLSGEIPSQISQCLNLEILLVFNNGFTGTVPSELGLLASLSVLSIGGNPFDRHKFPVEICQLSRLTELLVSEANLSGTIPTQIANLSALQQIDIQQNDFSGSIPSELSLLQDLQSVSMDSNSLTASIPSQIGILSNLSSLTLARNLLTGRLPPELGKLTKLQQLVVAVNMLSGTIPSEICQLWDHALLSLSELDQACTMDFYGGATCPNNQCCRLCNPG